MKKPAITIALGVALAAGIAARAQTPPPTAQDTVSRAEYEQLKRDQEDLKKELLEMKKERANQAAQPPKGTTPAPPPAVSSTARDAEFDEIDKTLRDIKLQLHDSKSGTEKFLIAGDAAFGFMSQKGTKSSFSAGIAPLVLWQPNEHILIEAAADIGISNDADGHSSTSVNLTIANASYIVNNNLLVGGGLFVAPFGVYHRHFDPPWINKLPDDPLVFSDGGLAPGSVVGVYASGAVPVDRMKFTYDAYVSNGPNLETKDPGTAGLLHFDNYSDLNNNKAVGGRLGFLPFPQLEVGYSVQYGKANSTDFKDVSTLVQAIDAAYRRDFKEIYGTLDIHGEWVWSNVGKATYDPTGALGFGPARYSNARQGGYLLVAYRPSLLSDPVLKKLEFIVRYDAMKVPLKAPGGDHEQRWTLGVDYWITPAAVFKVAYEIDQRKAVDNANAFFIQLGLGL